jgi:hypothetical protein
MRPISLKIAAIGLVAGAACTGTQLGSVNPDLVVDTVPIDFGNQPVLTPATKVLSMQNIGRGVLHISQLGIDTQTPSGSTAFTPATFSVTTLNPEQSTTLKIVFSAPAMGPYTAILEIKSDDENHKSIQIQLKGNATTAAVASAMPDCLDFGRIAEGTTAGCDGDVGGHRSAAHQQPLTGEWFLCCFWSRWLVEYESASQPRRRGDWSDERERGRQRRVHTHSADRDVHGREVYGDPEHRDE